MTDSTTWDSVLGFFAGRGISGQEVPTEADGDHALKIDGTGENGDWVLWAYLEVAGDSGSGQFSLWCTWPQPIPVEHLDDVAAWVALANPGMTRGSFEIDPDDDVLSLRRSIDVRDGRLDPETVEEMVEWAVETFDDALGRVRHLIAN